jgi:uncharacterized protein (DUF1499 family)
MCDTMLSCRIFLLIAFLTLPVAASSTESERMSQRLAPCPDSPNCVSSDAADAAHRVAPFALALPVAEAWRLLGEAVRAMPRTTVTETTDAYLHVECRSLVFRFVDDLELELRKGEGVVAVRSASRVGHSDFGVNRRRIENLRKLLRDRGVIK